MLCSSCRLRGVVRVLCLLALTAVFGCGERSREMKIVIVSLDTTRPDHLSAYGYDKNTSPGLAQLAEEGTLFTNARTTSPWTLPAHVSLFTGMNPREHDVVIDFQTISEDHETIGEAFKDAEYHTFGLFTAPYVHDRFGFDRGFDIYEDACEERMLFDLPMERWNDAQMGSREFQSHRERTSEQLIETATSQVLRSKRPRSLMFMHFFDPHYDFRAPKLFEQEFVDRSYLGPVTGDNPTGSPHVNADMSTADLDHLKALYNAEIRYTDLQLGLFMNTLRQQNDENTLVIVVADHGEEFFEHGRFGHRANLKDASMRVPMIVWGPGIVPAGHVIDDDVSIVDVLPTALDYAGLKKNGDITGRSLRPLIESTGEPKPVPVFGSLSFFPADPQGYYIQHDSMVYDGMKVIRQIKREWDSEEDQSNLSGPMLPKSDTYEIYDVRADPLETHNLYTRDSLSREHAELLERFDAELSRQGDLEGQESDMDLRTVLEKIGYIDTQILDPAEDG